MNKLMQESWEILSKNPNLYFVPALFLILGGFIDPTASPIVTFVFLLLSLALTTGWTNQIKKVILDKDKRTSAEDVLIGIGRYFSQIMSGSLWLIFLFLAFLLIFLSLANSLIGMTETDLEKFKLIANEISKLKSTEDFQNYFAKVDPALIQISYKWAAAAGIYALFAGTIYFFIGLWSQYIILGNYKITTAIKNSYLLVVKKFGLYTVLSLFQTFFTFTIYLSLLMFGSNLFLNILITISDIISKTWFTVIFCLLIVKFDENILINYKNELQSATSEVQKPDHKQ